MRVSLITVCYNSEKTIARTLDSVKNQTYGNIEYIIIDGGSKDRTLEIISEKFGNGVVLVSEPDKGMYDAINKGIRLATGDVIGLLNSDDAFADSNSLERLISGFTENVDLVYADVHFVRSNGSRSRYYSSRFFQPWLFRFGIMPAHPTVYLKSELAKSLEPYRLDFKIAADYEYLIRLFRKARRTRYMEFSAVEMFEGGLSTRDWRSNVLISKEIVRACTVNGIGTNLFFVLLKYPFKLTNKVLYQFIQ